MFNEVYPRVYRRTTQLLGWLIASICFGCSGSVDEDQGGGDGGTDTGPEDTDSWLDEYNMPFDPEPFQWTNVPGGLEQPTAETFASNVLLIMFFQKW